MWTVPLPVLRLVALLLLACAVGAFALGLLGAEPGGGRLPGEASGAGEIVAPVVATEAQPLDEGGAAARPAADQAVETAEATEETTSEATADAQVPALQVAEPAAPRPAPPPQKAAAPAQPAQKSDAIGDLVDGLTPPPELPPF